jgi:hypothetical protein
MSPKVFSLAVIASYNSHPSRKVAKNKVPRPLLYNHLIVKAFRAIKLYEVKIYFQIAHIVYILHARITLGL